MTFELAKSRNTVDEWRVEAIDFDDDGHVYVALFSGPLARERAEEYAAWKNKGKAATAMVAASLRCHCRLSWQSSLSLLASWR